MASKSINFFRPRPFLVTSVFGDFTVDAVPPTVDQGLAIQEGLDGLTVTEALERVVLPFLVQHVHAVDGVEDVPEVPPKKKDRLAFWRGLPSGVCFDSMSAVLENRTPPKSSEPDA